MKEFAIEKTLNDMVAAWEGCDFEVMPYRNTGTGVIKLTEEVNSLLDDHIVLTQQFSFSPYKGPFEERIADWERKLRLVQEVPHGADPTPPPARLDPVRTGPARRSLRGR